MHHIKWYGRRLYGGSFQDSAGVGVAPVVYLYNDSTIGHILRVRWWSASIGGGAFVIGAIGAGVPPVAFRSQGVAQFAGEQQGAGSIYAGTYTTATPNGQMVAALAWFATPNQDTPFWYIRPNYNLGFFGSANNVTMTASWLWEDLEPSMLEECEWH